MITSVVIPITRSVCRKFVVVATNVHLNTVAFCAIIRFSWSPVSERWDRVIKPVECFGVSSIYPLQSHPDLVNFRCMLSHEIQDKLVLFKAVYLYQVCFKTATVRLSLGPTLDSIVHMVTGLFKLGPFSPAGIWKRVEIVIKRK